MANWAALQRVALLHDRMIVSLPATLALTRGLDEFLGSQFDKLRLVTGSMTPLAELNEAD